MSHSENDDGFSLLELAVTLWITVIAIGIAVPAWNHLERQHALTATSQNLLWTLRKEQSWAVSQAQTATVDLYPYQPAYDIYHNVNLLSHQTFEVPVHYVDGYLQMPSHRISYGPSGASDVMGTITLTDGVDKTAITLYRGGGLQTFGGDVS
jgi:type II secretory pathway pseudopilin PulG